MSDPEKASRFSPDLVELHGNAQVLQASPLTVRTPEGPWSYAISLPLDGPPGSDFVVDAVLKVTQGTVGASCTGAARDPLAGERVLSKSEEAERVEFLADPEHGKYLLIRNGGEQAPAIVQIHSVSSRPFNDSERAEAAAVATLQPMARWSRFYGASGESLVERARVRDYLRLTAPLRRPWVERLSVMIRPGDQLSRALHVSGLYEPNTAVVLKRLLKPGATFVDLGAHAGIFTMLGSRFVGESGRVFSFEPSPRERARLDEHVSINGLTNVTVMPMAVAGHQGPGILSIAAAQYGGLNTLGDRFAYEGVERIASIQVEVTTLDRFVQQAGIRRVDVIKLDIEGAECDAMRGAAGVLHDLRPALILEVVSSALSANQATRLDLQRLLSAAGYQIFQIDDETAELRPIGTLMEVDEQNVVALPA